MIKTEKLNFVTAGTPLRATGYDDCFDVLRNLNLDGMELEFVHGVRMNEKTEKLVKKKSKGLILTAHAPYYINLNSKEEEKIEASIIRIIETAKKAKDLGAYSIVYHAAFNMGKESEEVYKKVKEANEKIFKTVDFDIWIRPETTGKPTQWGDLDEVIRLSKDFEKVLPCIDFAHLFARHEGKFNTYDEFSYILEHLAKELGESILNNFHGHVAGIAFGDKGEKNHLVFEESNFNYKDLLKVLKSFKVKGVLVTESPNIEEDAMLLKEFYSKI